MVAVSPHVRIDIRATDEGQKATAHGLLTCNHVWTCPVCSSRIRAERAEEIRLAIEGADVPCRMLTVTFRHHFGETCTFLFPRANAAWRETRQGGAVQRVWTKNVRASAVAREVTFSFENGPHVHFHVLLWGAQWTDEETEVLYEEWAKQVRKHLGPGHEPARAHGLHWSRQHDGGIATYLSKLGMEVSGYAKQARHGSLTPWDIAELAAKGDAGARAMWEDFQRATKGRKCINLDARAKAFAAEGLRRRMVKEEDEAKARGDECREDERIDAKEPVQLVLFPEEVRAFRVGERVLPGYGALLLRALEMTEDHEACLRRATAFVLEADAQECSRRDLDSYLRRFEVRELEMEFCSLTIAADRRPDPFARPAAAQAPPPPTGPPPVAPVAQPALPWVA
jgi:hypothetical protein